MELFARITGSMGRKLRGYVSLGGCPFFIILRVTFEAAKTHFIPAYIASLRHYIRGGVLEGSNYVSKFNSTA
jgi:hypothetical protein